MLSNAKINRKRPQIARNVVLYKEIGVKVSSADVRILIRSSQKAVSVHAQ